MRPLSTSRPISGIFSSEALNSELGHPASGAAPLEHGPGRMFTLQPGKERERQESGSFFFERFIFIVPPRVRPPMV